MSNRRSSTRRYQNQNQNQNWLGDLWDEVLEFSTYGPAERKLLKAKREKKDAATSGVDDDEDDVSVASFQQAQKRRVSGADATVNNNTVTNNKNKEDVPVSSPSSTRIGEQEDATSLQSFQSAVVAASKDKKKKKDDDNGNDEKGTDFDGYQLRDMMVQKWGVPLDVDFQRGYGGSTVYCTVLPVVGFGSSRCRHDNELDYLMHLQGVIEILQKYQNLDPFLLFLQTTTRTPKSGVESAPYLMDLDRESLQQILEVR